LSCPSFPYESLASEGGALNFGGDEFVKVPASGDFANSVGSASMWVLIEGSIDGTMIAQPSSGDDFSWLVGILPSGEVLFEGRSDFVTSAITVKLNEWTHVAVTWSTTRRRIFINRFSAEFEPDDLPVGTNMELLIGAAQPSGGESYMFEGAIDELRVYDRELEDADIQEIMALAGE
jgi:hypothetical protein